MISFIIPAHNEEQFLGRTLAAVRRVGDVLGEAYEVIVVDDSSTDGTPAVAGEHGARVISVQHRQIAATRNSGAREAKGDKFFFIDADTEPTEEVVRAALEAMKNGAVGGGSGFRFDGKVPFLASVSAKAVLRMSRIIGLACGCFVFATREAFEKSGGFDEELYAAEEWAFSSRLKRVGKFVIVKEQVITSGRKMRGYSPREILGQLGYILWKGRKGLKSREGLGMWYGERRTDTR
jgi:glycosyltransferase involved in cell wall biosynthesis